MTTHHAERMLTRLFLVCILAVGYVAHAQGQGTDAPVRTQPWPADTGVVIQAGDSMTLKWAPLSFESASNGIVDVIMLKQDAYAVVDSVPKNVRVTVEVNAKLNVDHGDYLPSMDRDTTMIMVFEVAVRPDSISPSSVAGELDIVDKAGHAFTAGHEMQAMVLKMEVDEGAGYTEVDTLPKGLYFDMMMTHSYVGLMSLSAGPDDPSAVYIGCDGVTTIDEAKEIELSWAPVMTAVEYQVEWTWVDNYRSVGSVPSIQPATLINYDLGRDATRVITGLPNLTRYRIPILYDRGYIIWRVRAVGRHGTYGHVPIYSPWSGPLSTGTVAGAISSAPLFVVPVLGHGTKKNWQATSSFAEEGKHKEVVTYADGTSRSRQVVTRNNSLNIPIIGETIYDAVGRPAVQVMPVPLVKGECEDNGLGWAPIEYVPHFNLWDNSGESEDYSYRQLLPGVDACGMTAEPMHPDNGAQRYYSEEFVNDPAPLVDAPSFLPKAEGYPFSQTEYTRDNTGRVRSQGAVGPTFQVGVKDTRYLYGKPEQIELDRLFGSEAGYAQHYQKNVVIDANGQATVSYVDMFGRTVATALSCAGDTNLVLLDEPLERLSSDLFGGLASTDEVLGQLDNDGPQMVFTTQIPVACAGSYEFDYSVMPLALRDSCWMSEGDTLCTHCVYELEIILTNACGEVMFREPEEGVSIIGELNLSDTALMFSCTPPAVWDMEEHEAILLEPGEYTLTKRLRVHQGARDFYVQQLLDSSNNVCMRTFAEILGDHVAAIDVSDCHVTCAECYASLNTLDEFLLTHEGSTVQQYQELVEQCDELCRVDSWCDVALSNMLTDLGLYGQYCGFEWAGGAAPMEFPDRTSVLYPNTPGVGPSILALSFNNGSGDWRDINMSLPLWKQPWLSTDEGEFQQYRDEETGERTHVTVYMDDMGIYHPAVDGNSPSLVFEDENNDLYTYPEHLSDVRDFVTEWRDGWQRSLLRFHPEYCYYRSCKEYGEPYDHLAPQLSSDGFDGLMRMDSTFSSAQADLPGHPALIDVGGAPLFIDIDPFADVSIYGPYATELRARYDVYFSFGGTDYSMPEVAAAFARCGGNLSSPLPTCLDFGAGSDPDVLDAEWAALKGFYSSEKYRIQKKRADDLTRTCDCPGLNYCIGEDSWQPWWNRMQTATLSTPWWSVWWSMPLNQYCQPCNRWRYSAFSEKIPRVAEPSADPGLQQSPMQLAYQVYLQTGQCPMATAWQQFFQELAMNDELDDAGSAVITGRLGWTSVHVALNDMEMSTVVPAATLTTTLLTGPDRISYSISGSPVCAITLLEPDSVDFSWDAITAVAQLNALPGNTFILVVYYTDSNGQPRAAEVSGTMCGNFDLNNCNFPRTCIPDQMGRDLQDLLSTMAAKDQLDGVSVNLTTLAMPGSSVAPFVQSTLGSTLLARFNAVGMSLRWTFDPLVPEFRLWNNAQPGVMYRLDNLTAEPAFAFTSANLDNIGFLDNINSDNENFFTVDVHDAMGNLWTTWRGQLWFESGGVREPVAVGQCGLPPATECAGLMYQRQAEVARVLQEIFYTSDFAANDVDLFESPAMSDELALFLCPELSLDSGVTHSVVGTYTVAAGVYTYTFCDCLEVEVPFSGGLPLGGHLDLEDIRYNGAADDNGGYGGFRLPIMQSGSELDLLRVTSSCSRFYKCDPCPALDSLGGPIVVDPEDPDPPGDSFAMLHGMGSDEEMFASGLLKRDAVWPTYVGYMMAIDSLNDRMGWSPMDSTFVTAVNYPTFRRRAYHNGVQTYLRFIRSFDPKVDAYTQLQALDSFIVAYGNAINVKAEYARYERAVEDYNARAVAHSKPLMSIVPDSLFEYGLVVRDIPGYIATLLVMAPGDDVPAAVTDLSAFDEEDPCIQAYRGLYLPAYRTLAAQSTEEGGRCPNMLKFSPLASYEEFLGANLCCSDTGMTVLNEYLALFYDDSAKCPGELPRFKECPDPEPQLMQRNVETECQRLHTLWLQALEDYNKPCAYLDSTGIVLYAVYEKFNDFEEAGLCDCVKDYLEYLEPYLLPSPPPGLPKVLSIVEFCSGAEKDCEDHYEMWKEMVDYFNSEDCEYHTETGETLYEMYTFENFEQYGFCDCVEEYMAYLQVYLDWKKGDADLPKPLEIRRFCGVSNSVDDCSDAYDLYVTTLVALQPTLDSVNTIYGQSFEFQYPLETMFTSAGVCYCVEEFLARLQLLLADVDNVDLDALEDPTVWSILRACRVPVPCDPLGPLRPTPEITLPPGPDECEREQLANAYLNALNEFEGQIHAITLDITERYNSTCLQALETFTMTFDDRQHHYTLYYYDQAGNLIRTVPPEGVQLLPIGVHDDLTGTVSGQAVIDAIEEDRAQGTRRVFTDHVMPSDHVFNSLGQPIRSAMPDMKNMEVVDLALTSGLPNNMAITGSSFLSGGRGFASGYRTFSGRVQGLLYSTENGGRTWQRTNGLVGAHLRGAHFVNSSIGHAVGDHGTLIRTIDGGASWDVMPSALLYQRSHLRDVYFESGTTGVMVGEKGGSGYLAYTLNSGLTTSGTLLGGSFIASLSGIGHDGTSYVACGTRSDTPNGVLYTSSAANGTWTPVYHGSTSADLTCASFNGTNIYLGGSRGVLLRSGVGNEWQTKRTGTTDGFIDLYFADDDHGVAIMDSSGQGVLRHTADGGATWIAFGTPMINMAKLSHYGVVGSIHKLLAVGASGQVARVLLNGADAVVAPQAAIPAGAVEVWAAADGGKVRGLVVMSSGDVRLSKDVEAETVIWHNYTGLSAKSIVGYANGAVLRATILNSAWDYQVVEWDLVPDVPTMSTSISSTGLSLAGMARHSDASKAVLHDDATNLVVTVNMSGTPAATSVLPTPSLTIPAPRLVHAGGNRVVAYGNGGIIIKKDDITNTTVWSDRRNQIWPLPFHAMDKGGEVAVGAQGTIHYKVGGYWRARPTENVEDLRDVAVSGSGVAVAVGDDGVAFRMDPAVPSSYYSYQLPTPTDLNAVALNGSSVGIGGGAGRTWEADDLADSPPAFVTGSFNAGDIHALAFRPSAPFMHAFGDHSMVHGVVAGNHMVINDVFPPRLNGVHLQPDGQVHIVGDNLYAVHSADAGQHWNVVPVLSPSNTMKNFNAVHANGSGRTVAVGSFKLAVDLDGTAYSDIVLAAGSTSTQLRAVSVSQSGATVITGDGGRWYMRSAIAPTWTTDVLSGSGAMNTIWGFKPYMDQGTGVIGEDFLIGGVGGYVAMVRYSMAGGTFSNLWDDIVPVSNITSFWFHDRVSGLLGTTYEGLFSTVPGNLLDHSAALQWNLTSSLPINGLNGQTTLGNIAVRTMGFVDRHQGFIGGDYNGSPITFARTIMDENELYAQRFWYDALGRIVVSQSSNQFALVPQRFSYTLYDELGRVFEAGELSDGIGAAAFSTIAGMEVGGQIQPHVLDPEVVETWALGQPRFEVTRTWYDEGIPLLGFPFSFTQQHLRMRVASTAFYETLSGTSYPLTWLHATHYSYDVHGNVSDMLQSHYQMALDGGNPEHGFKRIQYTYDLISGNVKQVDYQKGKIDAMHHRYTYDADNRIVAAETSLDLNVWDKEAEYFYYPHGPLQRMELGRNKVQGMDYAYTLQGWLKGVNSDRLVATNDMGLDGWNDVSNPNRYVGRDAFGFSLGYYGESDYEAIDGVRWSNVSYTRPFAPMGTSGTLFDQYHPLYNGNVAHITNSLQPMGGWFSVAQTGELLAQVHRYDQLSRLYNSLGVEDQYGTSVSMNDWNGFNDPTANRYRSMYRYDANGNIDTVARFDRSGAVYDAMIYQYHSVSGRRVANRLYDVFDYADPSDLFGQDDIPFYPGSFVNTPSTVNGANNYVYNRNGNLVRDVRMGDILNIDWTVAGKVQRVQRVPGGPHKDLTFRYGADGQRIEKWVGDPNLDPTAYREHYVRDVQGNIMATYRYTNSSSASLQVTERPLYGSSRLGVYKFPMEFVGQTGNLGGLMPSFDFEKRYELSDHLGNVTTVFTGRLLPATGSGSPYQAEVMSAQGYEPFGSLLSGRNYSSDDYRFGFNGKEKVDEVNGAQGTSYDYGFRIYDPRVARFLSVDPLSMSYPWYTPYQFAGNTPIWAFDLDGLEEAFGTDHYDEKKGQTVRTYALNTGANISGPGTIQFKYADGTVSDIVPVEGVNFGRLQNLRQGQRDKAAGKNKYTVAILEYIQGKTGTPAPVIKKQTSSKVTAKSQASGTEAHKTPSGPTTTSAPTDVVAALEPKRGPTDPSAIGESLCWVCWSGHSDAHWNESVDKAIKWLDDNPGYKLQIESTGGAKWMDSWSVNEQMEIGKAFKKFSESLSKRSGGRFGKDDLLLKRLGAVGKEVKTTPLER